MKTTKEIMDDLNLWNNYTLDEEMFTDEMKNAVKENTPLEYGSLDDWWVFPDDNRTPCLTWPELIDLALKILHCDVTRLLCNHAHLETIPEYKIKEDFELAELSLSGAKRVNASAGDYTDYSDMVGMNAIKHLQSGTEGKPKKVSMDKSKFRLTGKDESCCVEGTWWDWCCFAGNILAAKNTKNVCPELYTKTLKNGNY